MTVDRTDVVDFAGISPNGEEALLFIIDHLPWNQGTELDHEHMYLLQEKINAYLSFIESGEIYRKYPNATDKPIEPQTLATSCITVTYSK